MKDKPASVIVIVAAVIAAVVVGLNGGDSDPYLNLASVALGYGVGHEVQKARTKKKG